MRTKIFFLLLIFSSISFSETKQVQINESGHKLNGLLTIAENNSKKNVVLLVHGILGHQKMEIIENLKTLLYENNIDSLSINLSYGIKERENSFFECDQKHNHDEKTSLQEIYKWHKFLIKNKYQNIYLLGHSRGALNIAQYYSSNNELRSENLFLLAPPSKNKNDHIKLFKNRHNIDLETELLKMSNRMSEGKEVYTKINFFHCKDSVVHDKTFLSYYQNKINLIGALHKIDIPIYIFTASEDNIANLTFSKVTKLDKENIELIQIDGSGHMFRDLYLEEVMDTVLEVIR
ncbi:MAG: hypothetical protein VYE31_00280 [Pseudomonadota bacterium]|nr:hypothetical protein [Pseudomonadota bacterium]